MVDIDPGHEMARRQGGRLPSAADRVLEDIREIGIAAEDLSLSRVEQITLGGSAPLGEARLAWAAVLGEARANARPISRYLMLMIVARVIAAFGVIDRNDIPIVGAMAVSPDLLPLCACVALEARRPQLAGRAIRTLLLGLGLSAFVGALLGFVLEVTGWLPEDFHVLGGGVGTLARIDLSTIIGGRGRGRGDPGLRDEGERGGGRRHLGDHDSRGRLRGCGGGAWRWRELPPRNGRPRRQRDRAARDRNDDARDAAPAKRRRRAAAARYQRSGLRRRAPRAARHRAATGRAEAASATDHGVQDEERECRDDDRDDHHVLQRLAGVDRLLDQLLDVHAEHDARDQPGPDHRRDPAEQLSQRLRRVIASQESLPTVRRSNQVAHACARGTAGGRSTRFRREPLAVVQTSGASRPFVVMASSETVRFWICGGTG